MKKLISFQNLLIFLLGVIIILRLAWLIAPGFKYDMNTWKAWAGRLVERTPLTFYEEGYFADYFPGYLYLLWFLGGSAPLIGIPIFSENFEIYLKFLTNLFDLGTAFFIYKILSKKHKQTGLIGALLYLINPALALNSSVWGQVDGILAFFLTFSTYQLFESKKPFNWSLSSALTLIVKPQGIPAIPISAIYLLKNFKPKYYYTIFLIPIFAILLSLPFFLNDPVLGLFHLFQRSSSTYPYTSMFSYNLFSFAGFWIPDSTTLFGISYQFWGLILFAFLYTLILIPLIIKNPKTSIYYFAIALALFTFFLFPTRIHQRYLYPFFAFFLIYSLLRKSFLLLSFYILLSAIHLINLWYVYYYYNEVFSNPNVEPNYLYELFGGIYNIFSAINLISFGILMLIYYKQSLRSDD